VSYASETCLQIVESTFRLAGSTAIHRSSPLERCIRDINTLMADQAVAPRLFKVAGRAFLYADRATGSA
jgi:alkylation response protein AidB-like acyl-CoA dehydrogenase